MRRREFMAGLAGLAALPVAAGAQAPRPRRIGVFLASLSADEPEALLVGKTLQASLSRLGWAEGRDLVLDYRYAAGDAARMNAHVESLVQLAPDVIVVRGNRPTMLIKQATATIPVVFAQVGDPVGSGLIENLARPGGNITGLTHFESAMGGKWLELLKEIDPSLQRATVLLHPETPVNVAFVDAAKAAGSTLGVTLTPAGVRVAADMEPAVAAAAASGAGAGLVVLPHDVTVSNHQLIVAAAARHRLPAVYPSRLFVAQGGLMSYSIDTIDHWQQVARCVDRILRGEKPASLPVQAPNKFETVLNLKTAKSLGLTVPTALLTRADEVIE